MFRQSLTYALLFGALTAAASAQDFSNVKSGMLLGIYAAPGSGGMRVSSTIPGYSAQGRLFPGDVLLRVTIDGLNVYRLRTTFEMENAKIAIGPNREAALEIWRPSQGLMYAWVELTPIAAPMAAMQRGPQQSKAMFKLESEKPGARRMFEKLPADNLGPLGQNPGLPPIDVNPQPGFPPHVKPRPLPGVPPVNPGAGQGNPADLFK